MVGAQCATFCPPATNPFPPPRKPVILLSSISNPFPSKPTKRKNSLRQKLLKTLTNHVIPKTPSTNCVIPFETPQEQPPLAKESEETQELQSLTSEATAGIVRGPTQGNDIQRPLVKGVSSSNSTTGSKVKILHKADLWWLSLPYVLVICCHDIEGAKGLFTLESKGDSSHTIAFEDQGDATNFCYLLQSSFEDLGDFSAEIVPVPTKELNEAGNSDNMKVIVVKKGELKLYAGQPLEEVEMALRTLVQ